jgi:hypothetical protein
MDDYADCYNCTGDKALYECGFPMYGCELCRAYGNGEGKLKKEFRDKKVQIEDTYNGEKRTVTFTPPSYSCTTCRDTHTAKYDIWVDKLIDYNCSDPGHKMPRVDLPCHLCNKEEYTKEKEKVTLELNK